MTNKIDICNLALQNISQSQISSLEELSAESIEVALRFDHSRDAVLQDSWWGFAKAVDTLALIDETPVEWSLSYQLPNECITPRYIVPPVRNGPRVRFERMGTKILTDHADAALAYTKRITDTTQYHPMFVDALSWRLAADIAVALTGKRVERTEALRVYDAVLAAAKRTDANEDYHFETTDTDAEWIGVRN